MKIGAIILAFLATFWLGGYTSTFMAENDSSRYEVMRWAGKLVRIDKCAGTIEPLTYKASAAAQQPMSTLSRPDSLDRAEYPATAAMSPRPDEP